MERESQAKSNRRAILLLLLLLLFIVIALGLGVYFWQKSKINKLEERLAEAENQARSLQRRISEFESKVGKFQEATETVASLTQGLDEEKSKKSSSEISLSSAEVIKAFGFIKKIYKKDKKNYLVIDYAEFYTGEEADKAAIEDGEIQPGEHVPNDYYIRNKNPKLRTFEIADNVNCFVSYFKEEGGVDLKYVDLSYLKSLLTSGELEFRPFWIERKGNVVIKITEQYVP
jgi:hypothetical protein